MRTAQKIARRRRVRTERADDACPRCGTLMRGVQGVLKLPVNDEIVAVPAARHLRCPSCREVILRPDDARDLDARVLEIYRLRHGLLSALEIRTIRRRFGLTRTHLARLLHISARLLARWEEGRNVQNASTDILLRMLRDVPGSLEYLRRHAA